jgi:hypothetical protein
VRIACESHVSLKIAPESHVSLKERWQLPAKFPDSSRSKNQPQSGGARIARESHVSLKT